MTELNTHWSSESKPNSGEIKTLPRRTHSDLLRTTPGPRTRLWATLNLRLDGMGPVKSSPGHRNNTSAACNLSIHQSWFFFPFLPTINSSQMDWGAVGGGGRRCGADSEGTAAALTTKNTFRLNVGKKLFNINPVIQKCASPLFMCQEMKHLQALITSALSTPSSSSECDIAYRPTPPPPYPTQKI